MTPRQSIDIASLSYADRRNLASNEFERFYTDIEKQRAESLSKIHKKAWEQKCSLYERYKAHYEKQARVMSGSIVQCLEAGIERHKKASAAWSQQARPDASALDYSLLFPKERYQGITSTSIGQALRNTFADRPVDITAIQDDLSNDLGIVLELEAVWTDIHTAIKSKIGSIETKYDTDDDEEFHAQNFLLSWRNVERPLFFSAMAGLRDVQETKREQLLSYNAIIEQRGAQARQQRQQASQNQQARLQRSQRLARTLTSAFSRISLMRQTAAPEVNRGNSQTAGASSSSQQRQAGRLSSSATSLLLPGSRRSTSAARSSRAPSFTTTLGGSRNVSADTLVASRPVSTRSSLDAARQTARRPSPAPSFRR